MAEKRAVVALKKPAAVIHTPWLRDWLPGWVETDEARERRYEAWQRLPPEWQMTLAAGRAEVPESP